MSCFATGFLKPTVFPTTFEDLSFVDRMAVRTSGYEPFADLSAYDILNIVYTDQGINEDIMTDENNATDDDESEPSPKTNNDNQYEDDETTNYAYCQQFATHIPKNQKIPFGKPVMESDYKYCSAYGVRNMGTKDKPKPDNHYGFDIGCTGAHYDRPVFTPADGIVERVQPNRRGSSAGNYIVINHENGFKTYYMHLNTMLVTKGQRVSAGCQIATIGYTGGAKAFKHQFANVDYPQMRKEISHLHYEMHYSGSQKYVTDPNGKQIPIIHKFANSQSVDPAYFMGTK